MQSYDIKLHGSGLQIADSKEFDVPEDYNVPFPTTEAYICIPTIPDHIGSVKLDVYRDKPKDLPDLDHRYSGEIQCDSGTLVIETSLVGGVDNINFGKPGSKHIEIWSDKEDVPTHVAVSLTE